MSRLKQLTGEIHRRSLWQVLLIYCRAAWACFEPHRRHFDLWEGEMKRFGTVVLFVFLLGVVVRPAAAQKPINLALVNPVQIVKEDQSISAFRLNLIYGKNASMTGFDLGLGNHLTGNMTGVQWGAVNIVGGSFAGWQNGFVNINTGEIQGLQWGAFNSAGRINGLQLAIVNYAERANGVQIGLVNIIKEGGMFPFMVIANWGFED